MSMKLNFVNHLNAGDWENFVNAHPMGNIFQTPQMMEVYKGTKNYKPVFLAALNENNDIQSLVLAHLIREHREFFGSFSCRSIIQGGPLYVENDGRMNAVPLLMGEYNKTMKGKALYTQVRNMWDISKTKQMFERGGYVHEGHLNYILKLSLDKEELWSNLGKKRRNSIRKAQKSGITVDEADNINMVAGVYNVLKKTYKSARLPLADVSLFESAFEVLRPNNNFQAFVARKGDEIIGAIVLLCFKDTVFNWYAGALRDYMYLNPNDLLYWHTIDWSHASGYQVFDLGGAGSPKEQYGVRNFKKQFGGEEVNFGRFELVHNPRKYRFSKKVFKLYRRFAFR